MDLAPEQREHVEAWVQRHWKRCPLCGSKKPQWHARGGYNLTSDWKAPRGSEAKKVVSVIPFTCQTCFGVSLLDLDVLMVRSSGS